MLKQKKDKQPVTKGWKSQSKGGDRSAREGTARLRKGKYVK